MTAAVAADLRACDRAAVTILVDNVSDILSTTPGGVTPHLANLVARKPARALTGSCLCCANWGLSLGIDVADDGAAGRILFDAGPDRASLRRNAALLGHDLATLDAVVLSHGHWDHAGGLVEPFAQWRRCPGLPPIEFHANEAMFVRRGMRTPSGGVIKFRDPPTPGQLAAHGAAPVIDDGARVLVNGMAYLSGPIPRLTAHEVGLPGHVARPRGTTEWIDDPLIADERWLALRIRDKGLVICSACSHAGIVNVLNHAATVFPDTPIHAVLGGFHLSGAANEAIIDQTVEALKAFAIARILPGHCTGWRAVTALAQAFGERVAPLAVGQTHHF